MSATSASVVSCVECQRRKQKCNKQFPCNHCLKRGVSHLCRFVSKGVSSKASKDDTFLNDSQSRPSKKRGLDGDGYGDVLDGVADHDNEYSAAEVSDALIALGYMSHDHHLVLGNGNGPKPGKDVVDEAEPSEELKAALESMPAKPYTDCLIDNWLNGANHHYYALYPSEFRTQYDGWWATPPNKVSPELTSLILRVCACSLHFIIDDSVKERLETELKADAVTFAQRMHNAADKLSTSISPGKGGLVHVQQLFLTAFWYKSAEKWTEAWHALSRAIRAANEIGLHRDSLSEGMSEFDREMRRRLWGVLYMWDFALGSMLSRPLLVNHADCTFVMPTLALEIDPERPNQPSPFRHMNLHCQLCLAMAAEFAPRPDGKVDEADQAKRLRDVVYKWFDNLPQEYSRKNPDTQWDKEFDWVVFQRRYLHLIGYMSLFSPLKAFVTRNSGKPLTELESSLRASGVQAGLDLMDVSWSFFENLVSVGAKFHYAIFCIFDATTVMCSAFVHDEVRNLPQRETVLEAINKGLHMLEETYSESKTTAALYRILKGLLINLPLSPQEKGVIGAPKRSRASDSKQIEASTAEAGSSSNPLARRILSDRISEGVALGSGGDGTLVESRLGSKGSGSVVSSSNNLPSPNVPMSSNAPIPPAIRQVPDGYPSMDNRPPPNGQYYSSQIPPPDVPPPQYYGSVDQFIPSSSAGLVPSNNYLLSDSFVPSNGFVPSNDFQFDNNNDHHHVFHSGPSEHLGYTQSAWEPSPDPNSNFGLLQGAILEVSEDAVPAVPSVLEYWDWQQLDLGNPGYWGNQQPPHM
ncbi:fungal-specific transcription factor domain-containing protein [Triangularia verruculosa]|uniref:Fungal-specific transcription factor domain-containing protein n=1 Tax=Triangularia verruculosa TaxID=2587418 RepID=A0AAN6XQW1_9PEZI|nr:fungal-specific transcription factor domain-containing protein [Triangularia verruculosa]